MGVRAVRGATRLQHDDAEELEEATAELLTAMLRQNSVDHDHLISIIFTATPDLHCAFPAAAARRMGLNDVPLMCAQELDIAGSMPLVIRVLMHIDTPRGRDQLRHPYLRGTETLRAARAGDP